MEQNFQRFLEEQESIYSSSSFKKVGCFPEKCSANPQIVNSAYTGSLQDLTVQLCFPQILHINHTNTATSTTPDQFNSQALAKLCFGYFVLTLFGGLELGFFVIDWVLFGLGFLNQKFTLHSGQNSSDVTLWAFNGTNIVTKLRDKQNFINTKRCKSHLQFSPTVTISTSLSVEVTFISSLAVTWGVEDASITTTSSSMLPDEEKGRRKFPYFIYTSFTNCHYKRLFFTDLEYMQAENFMVYVKTLGATVKYMA